MPEDRVIARFHRFFSLAKKLRNKKYRDAYVQSHTRRFLAEQMKALRGDKNQSDFGKVIDKPQSVVSRLEDQSYGKWTLQTLFDVAAKTDRAVIVRIVDYPTFLEFTGDQSEQSLNPTPYNDSQLENLAWIHSLGNQSVGLTVKPQQGGVQNRRVSEDYSTRRAGKAWSLSNERISSFLIH